MSPDEKSTQVSLSGLRALVELTRALRVSLDPYTLGERALPILLAEAGTAQGGLWLRAGDDELPVMLHAVGLSGGALEAVHRHLAEGSGSRGWGAAAGVRSGFYEGLRAEGVQFLIPIPARGSTIGTLALGSRKNGQGYSARDRDVLLILVGNLGAALENAHLYSKMHEQHRLLHRANEELKDLDRLKQEFLSGVNHELRTPLTAILAYLDMLVSTESQPDRREMLETACSEGKKLHTLVGKLLELSSLTRESLQMKVEIANPAGLIAEYYRDRLPGIADSLRMFTFEQAADVPRALYDRGRVTQVLDVLVDNAVRFTPPGARIALSVAPAHTEGRSWVAVEVADDGPGIAPDKLKRIFEPFRQGDGSNTRGVGGLGIGLALARQAAEKMGGRLEARSEPGQGASFSLLLPAIRADLAKAA